jgi:hypothetical protein
MASKYAAANNAELALAVHHPSVLRIMSLVGGVDSLLPIYPTVDDARRNLLRRDPQQP